MSVAAKADYVNRLIQKVIGAKSDFVLTRNFRQKGKKPTHSFTKTSTKTIRNTAIEKQWYEEKIQRNFKYSRWKC